ncbi:MAG: MBL fold metallo-hydrolase [Candidatus Omnitrophota bacterium]|nr:MBL fold metallo-hydrolase [Candidatus Omnitrophota bacterium]RKY33874.1 MAG: MBL fold metallo-hydrolase [Candidatus Omnitrophota bacterium]RKY46395.1 MAG: MBL fold metallo-hydrolase [Candidatus Omnitrophota bacterium]HDN85974.1 MBL fold metallo-hydrolase [Candidatus Omnitrophota bacterium]
MDGLKIEIFTLGDFSTNAYVVINPQTKNCLLIDAPEGIEEVGNFLKKSGYNLLFVVLTHGHIDHIMGLAKLDFPFYIHHEDKEFLANPELNLSSFLSSPFCLKKTPNLIKDNDNLLLDTYQFHLLHTPGHTPGSICVLVDNFLFSGDTLFFDSIGRVDFPYASYDLILASIKNKILPLGCKIKVFPGHGPSTTLERELKNNPFLKECRYT